MTADVFIVTQVGLDASTDAASHSIFVNLTTFKVGSGYAYNPTKADTALHGTTLYTDNITSFATDSQGNLIINCTMNATAGPFLFGEVGIYTDTGALFALMALPNLQNKYSSLGSNVASTFTFQCYLRLGQAGGVINIITGGGGGGGGGSNFNYVMQTGQPPGLWGSADGGANSYVWNPSNFNVASAVTAQGTQNSSAANYNAPSHTWHLADGTTVLASLSGSGSFTANNIGITSDMRYKYDVETINDAQALEIVTSIDGITYSLVDGSDQRYPGISAQQLQSLFPVGVSSDYMGKLSVLYPQVAGALFPPAIRALQTELSSVKDELATLKGKLDSGWRIG